MTKVFIDGRTGTTGLRIQDRLQKRTDLTLLSIEESKRKDPEARKQRMNEADIVFLCLPDAAAQEAVQLVENPDTCIIDTSTVHRVAPGWEYGFPELGNAQAIAGAKRIANPGCHATGFISIVYPLISMGLLSADAALSCFSLTGYSGGGEKMIAAYESGGKADSFYSPGLYGLSQKHKHLPEMETICGLSSEPVFCPIVDDYYEGMATTLPLHMDQIRGADTLGDVRQALADFYAGQPLIHVASPAECGAMSKIYGSTKAGKDSLDLIVEGGDEAFTITALFDNLGKGASGAAIENMNLVLGVEPTTGLVL